MSRAARWALIIVIVALVGATAAITLAAASIYRGGTLQVAVEPEDGGGFSLSVPAGLANLALAFVPRSAMAELNREIEPVLASIAQSYPSLEQAPDFVLLEVHEGDDHVRVRKTDGRIVVDVHTDGERIHVAVPLRTVRKLVHSLAT